MLAELKIVLISVSDSIPHQVVSVLARLLYAFAADDDAVARTILSEHHIEASNSLPFRQKARPVPYAPPIFTERVLNRLLRLGIISEANPEECHYPSLKVVVAKKDRCGCVCIIGN